MECGELWQGDAGQAEMDYLAVEQDLAGSGKACLPEQLATRASLEQPATAVEQPVAGQA